MKTACYESAFRISGPLFGELIDHDGFPSQLTKNQYCGAWIFSSLLHLTAIERTVDIPVTRDAMTLTWRQNDAGLHQGPLLLTWFNFNPSMDK